MQLIKNQDRYALENSALDYYELKQPEVVIHMIKKKIVKPQLVRRTKATNKDAKDIHVKVLTGKVAMIELMRQSCNFVLFAYLGVLLRHHYNNSSRLWYG